MDEKTDFTFEFNPNRLTLSALLDEYLNEVSPMTESQISYHATYKLVQKYVEGVTFHDVTRAVRYFSPTYMITFENYIGILQIFFRKWEEYYKKAENSIKNILINIVNKNSYVSDEVQEIIDFFQEKFKDENLENSSIVNTIQKFIKDPHSNDINSILNKIIPKVDPKSKILVKSPLQSQKDFKIFIHVIDLFNISKCISFLNIFKKVKPFFGNVPLKIGFSVECKLREKSKFSRVVLHKNIELFNNDVYNNDNSNNENNNNINDDNNNNNNDNNNNTYDNNNNNLNDNNNNDSKNNSNHNGIKENNKNESNLERIFYRIDDTITLEFQLTDDELKEYTTDSGYEIIMNSPLIMKLYTVIIPNKLKLKPMKFLYGYLKIPLVPVLFAHGHEIRLSGNFIPLETQFKDDHFNLLLESDKIIKQNKNNFIVEEASDQVMLSFSVKADIDPYICVSSPFARNVEKVDVVDLKSLREKGIMGSESRSCQISAKDEITNKHHLLCFYVDANIEFDTDDLFEMLILDARKPGQNYNGVVRSPFTMYNNQFALLDPDSDYKDVLRPPSPFSENPDSFFKILQEHENLYSYNSIFSNPSKLTQLERCIILCGSLIKSGFNAYVCCGAIDMSDTYCVISFHKKKPGVGKYLHFIEGHVYPVSLISYSIKKDESSKLNKNKDLRLNNLFDLEFIGTGEFKIYNSVHVWCLSEVLNDALPSSFHITTIFNNKNVWINRQEQNSILRINLNLNDIKFWFPVLKLTNDDDDQTKNSLLKKDENQERKDIEKRYLSRYVYSKRKVTFYESFDKVKYEFYFKIEFELYVSENSIQIDVDLHNFLIENKKKLFDKYYTNVVMIDLINLNPVEIQKDKKYTKNKNSNGTDDDDISSSISGAPSFSDLKKKSENDTENQQEKPIQSKNKKILTKIPSTPDISPGPSMKKKMQKITSNPSIKKETTIPNVPSIPIIPTLMMRESSNSNFKKDMSSSSTRKTQSSSRTKKESSVSELISLNLDDNENSSMICQEIEKIIDPNINNDKIEKVIDPNINNDEIEKVIDPNINNEENEKTSKFFFFRKIEAPYFMMPDELLEYIIENNGLRYMDSFDIIINFKSLPLNNCKIDIIIAYDSSFFYPNPEDEIVEIEQYQ